MRFARFPSPLSGFLCLFVGLTAWAGEKTDEATRLRQLIKPSAAEEDWNKIPWGNSLWEARRLGAAKGKPILLWEMNGHPLGCT
jgi:hypothetical protein